MSIRTIVTRDFEQMSDVAVELVESRIARLEAEKEHPVLGLATGNSPTGLYERLAAGANRGRFDSGRWKTFNLDEYVGLEAPGGVGAPHPESYRFFMEANLFGKLSKRPAETEVPDGGAIDAGRLLEALGADPDGVSYQGDLSGRAVLIDPSTKSSYLRWVRSEILDRYVEAIERCGGIDLQILGVGGRGHVAFHEAGIPFDVTGLLLVELDIVTKTHAVEDGHFPSLEECPRFALTMSLDLVFRARELLVLANGPRKREAVGRALLEEPTDQMPLSYAQVHAARGGVVTFVVDGAAGQELLEARSRLASRGIDFEDRGA